MPVYDQSYKHWEGSLKSHSLRWWVITKYGIKTSLKKKAVRFLFTFALLPFVAAAVYIYGLTHIGKVSSFVREIGGHGPMPVLGGKVYQVEIDAHAEPFLEKLSEQGIRWRHADPGIEVFAPEGENSKIIIAAAKETGTEIKRLIPPGVPADFYHGYINRLSVFFFILLLAVGSGLIAKDVKFNALQIYLAKPITGVEYIAGKLGILFFFLVMVTLVPEMILFLLQAILVGDSLYIRHYWWVPAAIFGYSLLIILSGALPVLALSALSRNVRSAAFGGAALYWFSPMVAGFLHHSTGNSNYGLVSFPHNWMRVGEGIFGLSGSFDASWAWSLLILASIMVVSAVVLARTVRCVKVVR